MLNVHEQQQVAQQLQYYLMSTLYEILGINQSASDDDSMLYS